MTHPRESARDTSGQHDGPQWGKRNPSGFYEIGPQPAVNPLLRLMGLQSYKGPAPLPDTIYRHRTMRRARLRALARFAGRST